MCDVSIGCTSKAAGTVGETVTVRVGQADIPPAVAVGIHISAYTVFAAAQHSIRQAVAVAIEQSVIGVPVPVEVDQRTPGVLDTIEPEPAQLPASIHGHRPSP
jgi:hypothetical protein